MYKKYILVCIHERVCLYFLVHHDEEQRNISCWYLSGLHWEGGNIPSFNHPSIQPSIHPFFPFYSLCLFVRETTIKIFAKRHNGIFMTFTCSHTLMHTHTYIHMYMKWSPYHLESEKCNICTISSFYSTSFHFVCVYEGVFICKY